MQKKNIYYSIFIISALMMIWLYCLLSPIISDENGVVYYLRPGITKRALIAELKERGIIKHQLALWIYTFPQKNSALKVGEYHFQKGASQYSLWKQMTMGTGLFYRHFAIIPGWTFKQLRTELSKAQGLRHTTTPLTDQQIMAQLGSPNLSPEGEFYPDTYNYTRGNDDAGLLKRAFLLMQKKLQQAFEKRAEGLPYQNSYEALIVASLIEREAYLDSERPVIAGVLMNRLASNMLLQVDATVIFGLGDRYAGKILKQDLSQESPYNTYLHKGLPPTPIAIPSLLSLQAALHPQKNNFYYYVVKGKGAHEFSATLEAHHAAVDSQKNRVE